MRELEQVREAGRRSLLFSLLLLCSLVAARLPFPWSAVGLLFTAAALVAGGLAVAAAWSARRRLTVAVMGGGIALGLFLLLTQVASVALWPWQADLRDCRAAAATQSARAACDRDFEDELQRWTESLGGLGGGAAGS
ncbi:hypothetical protein [Pseudokineococcus lusitanus]|uniref:Uncharacterized protein n=1 Tax=Pseudokineococcus lusitanus TaxID=763993 RepID=A0A3N1HKT6_9ACTN|nr:hypothetical protein [Pseudokineococcus lusitanus]ROP43137.1 hypothetical protein EDC03_1732 [Pseudokineococcus lusitanus]